MLVVSPEGPTDRFAVDPLGHRTPEEFPLGAADTVLFVPDETSTRGLLVVGGEVSELDWGEPGRVGALERAAGESAARTARGRRARSREEALEALVLLAEHLARQSNREQVLEAIAEGATSLTLGFGAVVYERRGANGGSGHLVPHAHVGAPGLGPPLPASLLDDGEAPAVYTRDRLPESAADARAVVRALDAADAAVVACLAVGERHLLAVFDRRREGAFDPSAWYALRTLARLADAALERIELRERVGE